MSYIINLTSGNVFTTLQDGTTNTNTGLTLIGRNFPNYGQIQNDNLVKLLENFADALPPTQSSQALTPLTGTIWYDSGNNLLRVYDGTNWNPVSQRIVSGTTPVARSIGDQWYDSVNKQLNQWNGDSWDLVGPLYTAGQGVSGFVGGTIVDNTSVSRSVANLYASGTLVGILSTGNVFTPGTAITGFGTIGPGLNLASNVTVNGTVLNAQQLGNVIAANFARTDVNSSFAGDIAVAGNVQLGTYGNVYLKNNNLVLRNHAYQGNVAVYLNSGVGNVCALNIDGISGLASVYGDPVVPTGIVTKNYSDTSVAVVNTALTNLGTATNAAIASLTSSTNSTIASVVATTNANLATLQTSLNSQISVINSDIGLLLGNTQNQENEIGGLRFTIGLANTAIVTANTAMTTYVNALNSAMVANITAANTAAGTANTSVVAYINSLNSAQTANVVAANAAIITANVGMKSYVDATEASLVANLTSAIASVSTSAGSGLNLKANIQTPVFTANGSVFPQTASPAIGDSSNAIPTTSWTNFAISTAISGANVPNITVSTNAPSGGNNGDFWFQIG
jgi:hypothetical protein